MTGILILIGIHQAFAIHGSYECEGYGRGMTTFGKLELSIEKGINDGVADLSMKTIDNDGIHAEYYGSAVLSEVSFEELISFWEEIGDWEELNFEGQEAFIEYEGIIKNLQTYNRMLVHLSFDTTQESRSFKPFEVILVIDFLGGKDRRELMKLSCTRAYN